jgi:hypothetical protein
VFPGGWGPTIVHNGSHHIEIVLTTEMGIETINFFIERMKLGIETMIFSLKG